MNLPHGPSGGPFAGYDDPFATCGLRLRVISATHRRTHSRGRLPSLPSVGQGQVWESTLKHIIPVHIVTPRAGLTQAQELFQRVVPCPPCYETVYPIFHNRKLEVCLVFLFFCAGYCSCTVVTLQRFEPALASALLSLFLTTRYA